MRIWTTKTLGETFFPGKEFDLEIRSPNEIQSSFLHGAVPGDMALIDLPEDYIGFLALAKAKGIMGPFIFISPEPTIIEEQLKRYRALILDIQKNEISEIREVVNFIAQRYLERDTRPVSVHDTATEMAASEFKVYHAGVQVKDTSRIKQVLEYILRAEIPVIVSVSILEDGEPVTARGLCRMESLNDQEIVMHRFTPKVFSEIIRENTQIKLVLSHRDQNFDAVSTVLTTGTDSLRITVPDTLFEEKRRNIRVEPGRKNPVLLYILRKNERTTECRVVDISIDGLRFETGTELITGGVYGFTVVLPGERNTVLSYGKILYQLAAAGAYRYGVQLDIHPGDEERIAHYIMNREKEIASLLPRFITQKA
ncbi:MAG: PilZ domain-containing protein [Nitrospiraceae bacterium]|nr:PilZ domain-containing protein [Nitrospiraceae bacterium]